MNAYDFDDTIYRGESIYDFFMFCLKKDKKLYLYFPKVFLRLVEYKLNILDINKLYKTAEEIINKFVKRNKYRFDSLIKEFWDKNKSRLKPQFLNMLKSDDLIITGCPNFLINYIKDDLKVKNIICTEYDFENDKIKFICLGKNKVKAFNKQFKNKKINKFYTDSLSDIPLKELTEQVYLVKGNQINKIDKTKDIK